MPNVDEEAFRHRSEQGGASFDEPDEDPLATFPALIVDLAPLLAVHDVDVGDGAARQVREAVLITLQNEWTAKSGELMEHGLAWHVPRCMSTQRREEHEARLPNAMLSVFEYPVELDDRKTAAMWRLVQRPTPYEVCDALKAEVANARRPLRWQADMAEELEELAEREQRCMELREDARHALDDVKREREDALARMHAAHHDADAPPLTPQQIHSMLGHLDDLDEQVAEAEAVLEEAVNVEGGAADDADERTLIDLLLDAIFEFYPNEPSAAAGPSAGPSHPSHPPHHAPSWLEQQLVKSERKATLRRMWKSTFGRLPVASELALKHAPQRPRQPAKRIGGVDAAHRPRMLVPPPPGARRAAKTMIS